MPRINNINFSISDNPYFARQRAQIRLNLCGADGALLYPTLKKFEDTGRKTEEKMDEFLRTIMKPSKVNIDGLKGIFNCEKIQEDAIRGETLANKPEALKALKKAGIKRVIDLSGMPHYEDNCKKFGLEYSTFLFWGMRPTTREYIDALIRFIQTVQKGDYYIGCSHGTAITDQALLLSRFFNPKDKMFFPVKLEKIVHKSFLDIMPYQAKLFTPEDKQALGWTPQFEKEFNTNIEKELAELDKKGK